MNLRDALAAAPAAPPCFADRSGWAAYLLLCQETAKRESRRPFAEGKFRVEFDFCRDCTDDHKLLMESQRKCVPNVFRGVQVVTA